MKSFYVIIDVHLNAGKLYLVEKYYLSFFFFICPPQSPLGLTNLHVLPLSSRLAHEMEFWITCNISGLLPSLLFPTCECVFRLESFMVHVNLALHVFCRTQTLKDEHPPTFTVVIIAHRSLGFYPRRLRKWPLSGKITNNMGMLFINFYWKSLSTFYLPQFFLSAL